MDADRIQKRKERKSERAERKAAKKAERAAGGDEEKSVKLRASRIGRIIRTEENDLPAARSRLVAEESALSAADLLVVQDLLAALDAVLDGTNPESAAAIREACSVLEACAGAGAPVPATRAVLEIQPRAALPTPADQTSAPVVAAPRAEPTAVPSFMQSGHSAGSPAPPAVAQPAPVAQPASPTAERPSHKGRETLSMNAPVEGAPLVASALPFATGASRPATEPLDRFPLGVYAKVCAELQTSPQAAQAILARYGLSDARLRESVDQGHKARIAADPAIRQQFDDLYARALAALHPG